MKRSLLLTLFILPVIFTQAQNLWKEVSASGQRDYLARNSGTLPDRVRFYELDPAVLTARMQTVKVFEASASTTSLDLPMPDGSFLAVDVYESSILSPQLQAIIPNVRTFVLVDHNTMSSLGRITVHDNNITGLIFSPGGTVYINPVDAANSKVHITYYTRELRSPLPVTCGVTEEMELPGARANGAARVYAGDGHLRTYRLAVAATGEYYVWAGNSVANALAYITITINSVNAIYERDATIHFNLVTNSSIIYTDSLADPYTTVTFPSSGTLNSNNSATDAALGAGSYDVGIVFNNGWNGGLAQLSNVCGVSHARAAAGLTFGTGSNPTPGPQGPIFEGTVAHEMGHEFSATHTMIASNGGCLGNVTAATAYEPGGGSTIMAYAGTCTGNSYQNYSDLYFHAGSVAQIASFATTGAGNTCPTNTTLANVAPTVNVASSTYTIPISTPFMLNCSATDANANSLTYTWEQLDAAAAQSTPPSSAATSGPNFRSYPPSGVPYRYFPNMTAVLAGTTPTYEVLASVARTMNFRVNVRDNAAGGGANAQADVAVTTNAGAGPFTVTSQSTSTNLTADGSSTFTITWNVANTNAAPINCSNVDILFSADGGQNFNYVLLSNTPNDGTQTITIPNIVTSAGRIMVKSVGNIFFNVNAGNISISSGCGAEGATLSPSSTVSASPGNSALNLASAPTYGTALIPLSGTLDGTDPVSSLAIYNSTTTNCINFGGNQYRYDAYPFRVNVAGTYTFSMSGGVYDVNIYTGSFDPANPCTNFLASYMFYNGSSAGFQTLSASLIPGVQYTLTVGTFNSSTPTLPFAYTISLSAAPGGGNLYSGYPNPGGSFTYAYVMVNNATNNIVAISSTPDLRNSSTFPLGTYTVYGFSYLTANFSAGTLSGYVGGPFSTLTNDLLNNPASRCGNLSKNTVTVNVLNVLPVKLLPLTAVWEGSTVKLYWATAQETGSKNFEIERSADGQHFNLLKTVPAAMNSDSRTNYTTDDAAPLAGNNFYRVKAVDLDEKYSYSNIAVVRKLGTEFELKFYPNPAHTQTTIELLASRNGSANMELINANGSTIYKKVLNWKKGMNVETVDMRLLPAGIYYIRIVTETDIVSQKLVKI
jgi:hypothetical protein